MKTDLFYSLLDQDFSEIIQKEISGELKNKLKQDNQKKSYAFMHWFLDFYANINNTSEYIVDGNGDNSCDIILDRPDNDGERIFYLIQSKWNTKSNSTGTIDKDEVKSFLSDAQSIIKGDKEKTQNILFNKRYDALLAHIRQNGAVRIIFLSLKNSSNEINSNIKSLEELIGGKIRVDVFDINKIKRDYIARKFKRQMPPNPLENITNPEFEEITINISRPTSGVSDHIKIDAPFEAHVFTVRPSFIEGLVDKYGFSLFEKT